MAVFTEVKQRRISMNARLVNTVQERSHKGKADCKQTMKRHSVLAKKIGAIISNACGSRRKAQQKCIYNSEKPKETQISRENHELALTKSPTCGKHRVSKVHARGSRQKDSGIKGKKQSCKAAKRRLNVSSGLSGILRSTGFSLRKWKAIKSGHAEGCKGSRLKPLYGRIKRAKLRLKDEVRCGEKNKKHEVKVCEAEEDNGELELCKKRILLGEKCRPLNPSGALHYDKEGVILPEDFPLSENHR